MSSLYCRDMPDELTPPSPEGPPPQDPGPAALTGDEPNPAIRPSDKTGEYLVFDHGFVRLDAAMADDLSVVNSARVSFAVRKEEMDDRDKGLIRFLMRDRHGTPFEHNSFRFHIRTPIFVAREWFRHRIGSFNEESARYHKLSDEFYVPSSEAVRSQVGRPGAYSFEPVETDIALETITTFERIYKELFTEYERLIEMGVAKELARAILPFGIYTQFYWTINARALMNFLSLRNAEPAQYEIRTYAQAVEKLFAEKMPLTHECFVEFGRRAP
jgi:thymidylate synthase (FAD)